MADMESDSVDNVVVSMEFMRKFMLDCMVKIGTCESHAAQLADVLVAADYRGFYSHGLNRLRMYITDVQSCAVKPCGEPMILKERPATAWVDGNNLLGPVVGNFCMNLAVKKAKNAGIGWVVAKGSNHFGMTGWYSMRAMEHGCMGLAFTNSSPVSFPTRSSKAALGTSPISLAASGIDGDNFVLDMATTTVAFGKVEIAERKGISEIPEGWGVDSNGVATQDPKEILNGGGLCPLGGTEIKGGYKGYGIGMMGEIFCGILGGSNWGPNVRKWMTTAETANLGQCFVAVDTDSFAPGFSERVQALMDTCRNLPPTGDKKVLVAGEPERQHMEMCDKLGGIPYHKNQIAYAEEIAKDLEICFLTKL